MDYEKKYKEALRVAEGVHRFSSNPAEIKRMEEIFPELAESDDEKTRRGLIDFVKQYGDCFYSQLAKDYALYWLEKQKMDSV